MSYGIFHAPRDRQIGPKATLLSSHESLEDAVRLICETGLTAVKLGRYVDGEYRALSDVEVAAKARAYANHRRQAA